MIDWRMRIVGTLAVEHFPTRGGNTLPGCPDMINVGWDAVDLSREHPQSLADECADKGAAFDQAHPKEPRRGLINGASGLVAVHAATRALASSISPAVSGST